MCLSVIFAIIAGRTYSQFVGLSDGQLAFGLCDIVVIFYELICSSIYNRICYRAIRNVCYAAGCLDIRNFAVNKAVAGYGNFRFCKRSAVVGLACSFGCEGDGALGDFNIAVIFDDECYIFKVAILVFKLMSIKPHRGCANIST